MNAIEIRRHAEMAADVVLKELEGISPNTVDVLLRADNIELWHILAGKIQDVFMGPGRSPVTIHPKGDER